MKLLSSLFVISFVAFVSGEVDVTDNRIVKARVEVIIRIFFLYLNLPYHYYL